MGASTVSAQELIQGILRDFPDHQAGTRPVHSYGIVAQGRFRATDVAARFTAAAPLTDPAGVDVTVRFSSGTGDRGFPEFRRDVRGMAVRFHGTEGNAFDLVSMTLPVFFVRSVAAFQEFTKAAEPPVPPVRRPWWRDLLDALNLRTPTVDPGPGDAGVAAMSVHRPEACPALVAHFNAGTPESFATRRYHAVHAFRLTNADEVGCLVRFQWDPVAGVRDSATTAERYLQDELGRRGRAVPIQFVLRAQVADQGDDTSDPTRPWPQTRQRLVLGHLTLDTVGTDGGEELEFNPHTLPDGITADPGDQIFQVRGEVYSTSAVMRKAARMDASRPGGPIRS